MFLDRIFFVPNLGLAGAAMMVVMLLAAEAGFRLGGRTRKHADEPTRSQLTAIEGAGMALVGLLLAFTFSMAVSRFESRKQIVVNESNAIGTAYLRARLLPDPEGREIQSLLCRYVDVWLGFRETRGDPARVEAIVKELDQLPEQIWSRACRAAQRNPNPVVVLALPPLNEVFDRQSEFMAALTHRVPGVVILLLVIGASLSLVHVGYGCGWAGRRNFLAILTLVFLISAIIVVILDLDRAGRGMVQVDPRSMIVLRQSMSNPAP